MYVCRFVRRISKTRFQKCSRTHHGNPSKEDNLINDCDRTKAIFGQSKNILQEHLSEAAAHKVK